MRYLVIFLFSSWGLVLNAYSEPTTVSFNTLGNCSICKDRIEGAAKVIPGVVSVTWKIISDVTTVTYDSTITDVYTIMHVIANVGHDTEWFPAPDSAYNLLVGTCCEYQRTNNYELVQVGYLSLENRWFNPLGQGELKTISSFTIYPNPATDMIRISLSGDKKTKCHAALYDLSGDRVAAASFPGYGVLDIMHLPKGEYILVVSPEGTLIGRKKVIKR